MPPAVHEWRLSSSQHSNFAVSIYTFATLVTSVGNFHFLRTVQCLFGPPLPPLCNADKTHFSSDRSWIYHFPTLTGRTGVPKSSLQSLCSYYGMTSSFCAFFIFQWLQVARHTGIVTCLAQEHNTMSPVRVRFVQIDY